MYDSYGMSGDDVDQMNQANAQGFGGIDPNDFGDIFGSSSAGQTSFEEMFSDFASFFTGRSSKEQHRPAKRGRDLIINLELDFLESIQGCKKNVTYEKIDVCNICRGSRTKPGTGPSTCSACKGNGRIAVRKGPFYMETECSTCGGAGQVIKHPCESCRGEGFKNLTVTEVLIVPSGVDNGVTLRMSKKGNASSGSSGDLMIKVHVKTHPYFKRDGYDIHTDKYITVSQAILGSLVEIQTLYGKMKVAVSPGTNHGDTKKISNYGVNKLPPNNNGRGNHYVHFKIKIPKSLNSDQRKSMQEFSEIETKIQEEDYNINI